MSTNSPIKLKDYFFKGEDQTLRWMVHSTANVPQDISGWTIFFKMASAQGEANVVSRQANVTAVTGRCEAAILAADTAGLAPETYWYQLERTDAGFNSVLAHGDVILQARVP